MVPLLWPTGTELQVVGIETHQSAKQLSSRASFTMKIYHYMSETGQVNNNSYIFE